VAVKGTWASVSRADAGGSAWTVLVAYTAGALQGIGEKRDRGGEMTRDDIIRLALDAGLLNYVDNETPRRYFIHGHADLEDIQKFAQLIVKVSARDCAAAIRDRGENK